MYILLFKNIKHINEHISDSILIITSRKTNKFVYVSFPNLCVSNGEQCGCHAAHTGRRAAGPFGRQSAQSMPKKRWHFVHPRYPAGPKLACVRKRRHLSPVVLSQDAYRAIRRSCFWNSPAYAQTSIQKDEATAPLGPSHAEYIASVLCVQATSTVDSPLIWCLLAVLSEVTDAPAGK